MVSIRKEEIEVEQSSTAGDKATNNMRDSQQSEKLGDEFMMSVKGSDMSESVFKSVKRE